MNKLIPEGVTRELGDKVNNGFCSYTGIKAANKLVEAGVSKQDRV